MANGAPTVSNGLVISGVTTTSDIKVGTGVTLNVYGGATFSGIATINGNVTIGGTEIISDSGTYLHIKTNAGEDMAKFQKDGGTFLYFNNSQRLVTDSGGVSVTGRVAATSFTGDGSSLTGIDATQIVTGNTSVQTVDTGSDGHIKMTTEGTERVRVTSDGHFHPHVNATYDLGISGKAWRNLYVNDAHFSNEGHSNSVDGTWGSWTLQEGENDIFMINNRTGKKYAITMREVE